MGNCGGGGSKQDLYVWRLSVSVIILYEQKYFLVSRLSVEKQI